MWGDWFNHAMYFGMFVTGAVFATQSTMWHGLVKWRWPALVTALGCWAVLVGLRPSRPLEHLVIATMQWGALVAAIGFAQKLFNIDHPLRQRLTEAVFPVYIFHQTVLIVASQVMLPWQWAPAVEGPVLVAVTLGLSYAGYDAVRRFRVLRPWFGLRGAESDADSSAAPASAPTLTGASQKDSPHA
jgi:glucans biosynthesis protein C